MVYNPMTGGRIDLTVTDEATAVAEARWTKARTAYLKALIKDAPSEAARASYQRELKGGNG